MVKIYIMKKMKLIGLFILLTLIACGHKDKVFKEVVTFEKGFNFVVGGTLQTISYTGTGGTMTYPSAGIPISTGTAWAGSITNNSPHWDLAYSWGNHAGLYRPIPWKPDYETEVLNKPEEVELSVAIVEFLGDIQILTQTQINALVIPAGKSKDSL